MMLYCAHILLTSFKKVVNVVAHHVPTVQVSPDHLQVVWCRQLVKVLCKSMFDLIDPSTLTLTADIGRARDVFRRDLLGGGEKMSPGALPTKSGVTTVTVTESSFSRTVRGRDGWQKFVIEETANVGKEANLVLHNPPKSPWLYHCVNAECVDITSQCTQYLSEGGVIYHYSKVLSEGSVVVFLNTGHSKAKESSVFVDVIEKGSNVKGVELLQHTAQYSNSLVQVIEITAMREDYWISGRVQVTAGKCDVLKSRVKFPVSLFQHSFEDKYSISSEGKLDTVIQKLTLNDPFAPRVVLLLDPHCEYSVELTVDTTETAANLIRFQYHLLLPALLCVMLGVSSHHLSALPGSVKSDFLTFIEEISNIYTCALLVGVKCLTWLLPTLVPSLQAQISFLPNFLTLRTEILIITLLTCFVMCFILSSLCRVVCWGIGCVLRRTKLVVSSSPVFFNYKFQGILLILGMLTTGSLVLIINVILLLISTCSIPPSSAARHQLSFTFLLFNFIGMLTGIPTFASWVKNLTVGVLWLEHDTSYIFALVSSLSVVLFYKHPANKMNSFQRCAHVMRMMKYLTLTCLFTYPHIVPWVYFAVILMIASSHFLRSISSKKDS